MDEQSSGFINEKIGFRKLMPTDINALLDEGFADWKWVLDESLGNRLFKATGLLPNRIGFVAYSIQEKHVLGFLSLVKHTTSLFSIGYVYTVPGGRKRGIGTELLNYGVSYARKRGAKKIWLTSNLSDSSLLNFYRKRGFSLITDSSILWGGGSPEKLRTKRTEWEDSLVARPNEKDQLLKLCREYMGTRWVDFFELNSGNLINGFLQTYRRFFSKDVFVSKSTNSFALVFKRPLPSSWSGFVELYVSSDSILSSVLGELSLLLSKKGIAYSKITVFNVNSLSCFNLLKEREFYPFQARILGRTL